MSVNYYGYSRMPNNLYETFPFEEVQKSKEILKQYTSTYVPRTKENNRFVYTGTEINQIKHQTPFLQRSLIEGMDIPIFEYYNRVTNINPRPDYIASNDGINNSDYNFIMYTDMTSNEIKLFKREFG